MPRRSHTRIGAPATAVHRKTIQDGEAAFPLGKGNLYPRMWHAAMAGEHPRSGARILGWTGIERDENRKRHASAVIADQNRQIPMPCLNVRLRRAHGTVKPNMKCRRSSNLVGPTVGHRYFFPEIMSPCCDEGADPTSRRTACDACSSHWHRRPVVRPRSGDSSN